MKKYLILAASAALLMLAACGIKPGELSPPEGSEKTVFPKTYPAPETLDNRAAKRNNRTPY